jgi:hypothetical protein
MHNAEYYSSLDWETGYVDDYGLEGDLKPFTLEEAAVYLNITPEDLLAELTEIYPYHFEGNLMDAIHISEENQPEPKLDIVLGQNT